MSTTPDSALSANELVDGRQSWLAAPATYERGFVLRLLAEHASLAADLAAARAERDEARDEVDRLLHTEGDALAEARAQLEAVRGERDTLRQAVAARPEVRALAEQTGVLLAAAPTPGAPQPPADSARPSEGDALPSGWSACRDGMDFGACAYGSDRFFGNEPSVPRVDRLRNTVGFDGWRAFKAGRSTDIAAGTCIASREQAMAAALGIDVQQSDKDGWWSAGVGDTFLAHSPLTADECARAALEAHHARAATEAPAPSVAEPVGELSVTHEEAMRVLECMVGQWFTEDTTLARYISQCAARDALVSGLVIEWRARSARADSRAAGRPYTGEHDRTMSEALESCADELEEVLAAAHPSTEGSE